MGKFNLLEKIKVSLDRRFNQIFKVETAPSEVRDIYGLYTEEFSALKSDNIKFYMESARLGLNYYLGSLFDTVRQRDLRIGAVLYRRDISVLGEEWIIDSDDESEEMEVMKEFCYRQMKVLKNKMSRIMKSVVAGNYQGVKIFQLIFDVIDGLVYVKDIIPIENNLYLYDNNEYHIINSKEVSASDLLSKSAEFLTGKINISGIKKFEINELNKIVLKGYDGNNKNGFMNGLQISLTLSYYIKSYNKKDLQIYIERFASPMLDAEYNPLNPESKTEMAKALQSRKAFKGILRPAGTNIKYINDEQKQSATNIFLESIRHENAELTLRTLGEMETSEMKDVGSQAALTVKKMVSDDFMLGDLMLISEMFNMIYERTCKMNFGDRLEYPEHKFIKVKTLQDKKLLSEIYSNLSSSGFKIDKTEVEENFDVKLADGEDTETEKQTETGSDSDIVQEETEKKDEKDKAEEEPLKDSDEEFADKYIREIYESSTK